jgi:hypothetical protein
VAATVTREVRLHLDATGPARRGADPSAVPSIARSGVAAQPGRDADGKAVGRALRIARGGPSGGMAVPKSGEWLWT